VCQALEACAEQLNAHTGVRQNNPVEVDEGKPLQAHTNAASTHRHTHT